MAVRMTGSEQIVEGNEGAASSPSYPWLVFALTFGLMLSDYMSRQVIVSVFPALKAEWGLTDTQLGSLVSVVALVVGIFTVPVALLADRVGRVKSAAAMAIIWGLATIACGLGGNFMLLFGARALIGLGEAGYGSAGGAILVSVFPPRRRSAVIGAFLSASMFGSVLGVLLGGVAAKQYGWRVSFILVGIFGLILAVIFPILVREPRMQRDDTDDRMSLNSIMRKLLMTRTLIWTYIAAGLMMFVQAALISWIPSYLNRYYGVDMGKAAMGAAALVLASGIGMPLGGVLVDRMSRTNKTNKLRVPMAFALLSSLLLFAAFAVQPGKAQLVLIGLGLLIGAGFAGPAGTTISELTHPAIHAGAFSVLTLALSVLGTAPGPVVTGVLADLFGLKTALMLVPCAGVASFAAYFLSLRHYPEDMRRQHAGSPISRLASQ